MILNSVPKVVTSQRNPMFTKSNDSPQLFVNIPANVSYPSELQCLEFTSLIIAKRLQPFWRPCALVHSTISSIGRNFHDTYRFNYK